VRVATPIFPYRKVLFVDTSNDQILMIVGGSGFSADTMSLAEIDSVIPPQRVTKSPWPTDHGSRLLV